MKRKWISLFACVAVTAAIGMPLSMAAQTFQVIHTFTGGTDGADPTVGLTVDRGGNLYGTTYSGGTGGDGTVFRLKNPGSGWIFQSLYSFSGPDGANPDGRVIFGPDGALYGSTKYGGNSCSSSTCGTVFKLTPSASFCRSVSCPWSETVLYEFAGGRTGQWPTGDLVFDPQGNIYGTTSTAGGLACSLGYGCGTVYELAPADGGWVPTVLATFPALKEPTYYVFQNLAGGVVRDSAGNFYGAVAFSGYRYPPVGYLFKMTESSGVWTVNDIHDFESGTGPEAGPILDGAGHLFGTTPSGGSKGGGVVYEVNTDGSDFNVIYGFSGSYGGPAANLVMDSAGNLYGTSFREGAYQYGSVFELSPSSNGWNYTDLYDFTGASDGANPSGSVALDASGNLYGTTTSGGSGNGVVWEITRTAESSMPDVTEATGQQRSIMSSAQGSTQTPAADRGPDFLGDSSLMPGCCVGFCEAVFVTNGNLSGQWELNGECVINTFGYCSAQPSTFCPRGTKVQPVQSGCTEGPKKIAKRLCEP